MKIVGLAVVLSVIEVPALVKWLGLTSTVAALLAAGFLFLFVAIEETLRFRTIKRRWPSGTESTLLGLGVLIETVSWGVPVVQHFNAAQAFLTLFVGLGVEHAVIKVATDGALVSWAVIGTALGKVIDFTAVEAVGGALWLAAPTPLTVAVLGGTSLLEHVQGLRQAYGQR